MSYTYGVVAYNQTPLAEFDAGGGGNYRQVTRELLGKLKFDGSRCAFDQDRYIFSVFSDTSKLAVLVLSDRSIPANNRFYVVDQIRTKFVGNYLSVMSRLGELSRSSEFGPEIARVFRECTSPTQAKIAEINANLAATQQVMTENLARALQRSEQLEVMEKKAEDIRTSAQSFKREADDVNKMMCWQRCKWFVIGGIVAVVVIAIVVVVVIAVTLS
jgi:hypothetical protein